MRERCAEIIVVAGVLAFVAFLHNTHIEILGVIGGLLSFILVQGLAVIDNETKTPSDSYLLTRIFLGFRELVFMLVLFLAGSWAAGAMIPIFLLYPGYRERNDPKIDTGIVRRPRDAPKTPTNCFVCGKPVPETHFFCIDHWEMAKMPGPWRNPQAKA